MHHRSPHKISAGVIPGQPATAACPAGAFTPLEAECSASGRRDKCKTGFNVTRKLLTGFTIVEMLVSISIFTLITSLVLVNYPRFSQHFALERTAQEVATSLREAKILSMAVTESAPGVSIFPGYGVHFDKNTSAYLIFADIWPATPNKLYDPADAFGAKDRVDSSYNIQSDAVIQGFCSGTDCVLNQSFNTMDIVFMRPKPTITFFYKDALGSYELSDQSVSIFAVNAKGDSKRIDIWKTGQISVK